MAKVLLVNPPHVYNRGDRPPSSFPLALGYIARYLLKAGHSVEVFDIWANQWPKEEVLRRIPKLEYDIAMISAIVTQYKYVKWMSKELKKHHNKPLVLGGGLSAHSSHVVLKNTGIDVCAKGDGEVVAPDIANNIGDLAEVRGISYKENGSIVDNPPAELIKNLDEIEFPAWGLFNLDVYLSTPSTHAGYFGKQINMMSARGCPYNCNFCSKVYRTVRLKSVDSIIREIQELKKGFGVEVIEFSEELVMISKQRMLEICEKIKPLKIKWSCQGRVNVADYEVLKVMKDAGCVEVGYGIESGSKKILDLMNKNADPEMALRAVEATRKAGLRIIPQMMYGYIGEDDATSQETIDWCNRAHINVNNLSLLTPLPGTVVYDDCIKKGLIKDEDKYLEGLEGTGTFMVNLTKWPDDELLMKKKETEMAIHRNYYRWRRHNIAQFAREYRYKLMRLRGYVRKNGVKKTAVDLYRMFRKNPDYILQAEYT